MTTANEQFAQNRSLIAISSLARHIESDQEHLQRLFDTKPKPTTEQAATAPPNAKAMTERDRLIVLSRKKLGLPTTPVPEVEFKLPPSAPPVNYETAFTSLVESAIRDDQANPDVVNHYANPDVAPNLLLKQLNDAQASIEKLPIEVWGIRASRLIEFQYAGSSFQFPYLFVATALIIVLPALIAGWLSSLYMTRQRELNEIVRATTINLVFPHVLNFVPVNYLRLTHKTFTRDEEIVGVVVEALLRVVVVTVIISPMLIAYAYSLAEFWKYSTWAVNLACVFLLYIFFQCIGIYVQEIRGLGRKVFNEA